MSHQTSSVVVTLTIFRFFSRFVGFCVGNDNLSILGRNSLCRRQEFGLLFFRASGKERLSSPRTFCFAPLLQKDWTVLTI
jgi:hypothetical protein